MKKIIIISSFVLAAVSVNAQSKVPSLVNAAPVVVVDSSKAAAKNTSAKPELKETESSPKNNDNSKSVESQKPVLDNASRTKPSDAKTANPK